MINVDVVFNVGRAASAATNVPNELMPVAEIELVVVLTFVLIEDQGEEPVYRAKPPSGMLFNSFSKYVYVTFAFKPVFTVGEIEKLRSKLDDEQPILLLVPVSRIIIVVPGAEPNAVNSIPNPPNV